MAFGSKVRVLSLVASAYFRSHAVSKDRTEANAIDNREHSKLATLC